MIYSFFDEVFRRSILYFALLAQRCFHRIPLLLFSILKLVKRTVGGAVVSVMVVSAVAAEGRDNFVELLLVYHRVFKYYGVLV